jgi:RNA polymerase sigma-70 factor (ECF subfamily)
MPEPPTESTSQVQYWIDRMNAGDPSAREQLIAATCSRLMRLTGKIKGSFPEVGRWEQTDDVFQNAALRLCRAMESVQLTDARHFFRLAAVQIRRELIDLTRHYRGPQGLGARHVSEGRAGEDASRPAPAYERTDGTRDPQRVAEWSEFHEQIEALPEPQREVFDLIWYHGLSQEDVAQLMQISTRSVKRLWREARLALHAACCGEVPGL